MQKGYKKLSSRSLLTTTAFEVVADTVELATGNIKDRFVVRHPGAVVILPVLDDGRLVLVEQYRHAIGQTILEFPAGTLERDEDPLVCAKREIREEIGYAADEWIEIGTLFPAPGFCDEKQFLYLGKKLRPERLDCDEDEVITVVTLTLAEVKEAILSGRLCDGKSLSIFLRALLVGAI